MTTPVQPWWRLAALVTVAFAAALVVGELFLRVVHRFHPMAIFYDDSYHRFRAKPFSSDLGFKINSRGFKDTEFAAPKPPGTYRVLGLGDSFAFGVVPYPNNYLTLLEEHLRARGASVEVLNMGIPGTGPVHYLSLLVREGLALEPDLVLVSFFTGNDFLDSLPPEPRPWYMRSYLAAISHYLIRVRPHYEGQVVQGQATYCDDCPSFDEPTYLKIAKTRAFIFFERDPKFESLLAAALARLREMRDLCLRRGIQFRVAIIPDEVQVNEALEKQVLQVLAPRDGAGPWNIDYANQQLAGGLRAAGIDVFDLTGAIRQQTRLRALYRPRDTHWNLAGNAFAADQLAVWLEGAGKQQ